MAAGRPSDYDPVYCAMLVDHMAEGFSYESFAGKIGTTRATLYNWEKQHPEFLDAKKHAFEACLQFWEAQGIKGLWNESFKDDDGTTVSRSVNASVWIFNMKNRFKWRDKQPDEEPGQKPSENDPKPVTTAEWAEILRKRMESEAKK
jgi:transcriptional regulator with XRE-family HTH domain